jgi:hypothetical protein
MAFGDDGAVATYGTGGWSLQREAFTKSTLLSSWLGSPTNLIVAEWTGGKIWKNNGSVWSNMNAPNQVWVAVSGSGQSVFAVGATSIFGLGSEVFGGAGPR